MQTSNEINKNVSELWLTGDRIDRILPDLPSSYYLLDIFIMLAELLVVEPKLIHKVGSHLLDLIVGEGLER